MRQDWCSSWWRRKASAKTGYAKQLSASKPAMANPHKVWINSMTAFVSQCCSCTRLDAKHPPLEIICVSTNPALRQGAFSTRAPLVALFHVRVNNTTDVVVVMPPRSCHVWNWLGSPDRHERAFRSISIHPIPSSMHFVSMTHLGRFGRSIQAYRPFL